MTVDRPVLDVNVDMGESHGRWQLGDDAAIMPYISSASIARGFHAGDPKTMRRTVRAAIEHGVLLGFGRRRMAISPEELRDYATYQICALAVFAASEGGSLGRTGIRLESHHFDWARDSGGVAGGHPSNILDNPSPVGGVNVNGDLPVILGPV
jgi:hypothetical protein